MLLLLIKVQTNFLQALHRTALTWLKNKNEQQISSTQANHIAEANLASPKAVTKQKAEVCVCVSNRVCEYDRDWVAVCWAAGQKNRWSHPRESKLQKLEGVRLLACWSRNINPRVQAVVDGRWADGEAGLECKDGLERALFELWANSPAEQGQQYKGNQSSVAYPAPLQGSKLASIPACQQSHPLGLAAFSSALLITKGFWFYA